MQPTIIIDAGHGGFDNGAVYNGRREKDDNLRLAMLVGARLEQDGFPVIYTRTTDVYQRPAEKATIANNSGGDYFVSIHRNASPNANMYSGIETLVFNDSGIPARMARAVNSELERVGFTNLGVSVRPELAVLRRTRMPAILVEAGFINTDADNTLLDANYEETANAIARGIENAVGTGTNGSGTPTRFGVQVGLFRRFENAQYLLNQLVDQGYQVDVRDWRDYYAVVVGDKDSLSGAQQLERELRGKGYDTLVVNNS
ncbi:MAG: N-acetylmuramoyl-L-alanine amidase [Eubacteriales bacterium]|nr:N-acetylmuramoyl-L-alanine amidase [Eubacteriales bacterium]